MPTHPNKPPAKHAFYRVDEVARILLVDERIILREIREQRLPCVILGERITRIPAETFEALKLKGVRYYAERKV